MNLFNILCIAFMFCKNDGENMPKTTVLKSGDNVGAKLVYNVLQ